MFGRITLISSSTRNTEFNILKKESRQSRLSNVKAIRTRPELCAWGGFRRRDAILRIIYLRRIDSPAGKACKGLTEVYNEKGGREILAGLFGGKDSLGLIRLAALV